VTKQRFSLRLLLLGVAVLAVLLAIATRFAENEYVIYGLVAFVLSAWFLWQVITFRPEDPDS
jgi:hypothetical protein